MPLASWETEAPGQQKCLTLGERAAALPSETLGVKTLLPISGQRFHSESLSYGRMFPPYPVKM